MRFRKKPIVIEAFQMTRQRRDDNGEWPTWLNQAWQKEPHEVGSLHIRPLDETGESLAISTMEGPHEVSWDDWIIRGIKGELYPCKPDIFEATYERAEDDE